MEKKKIFIITIALLLIAGTGSFVFAGNGNEELNVDNRPNRDQQVTPVPKDEEIETPVPVIKPPVDEIPDEEESSTLNPGTTTPSNPGSSSGTIGTIKPNNPVSKPSTPNPGPNNPSSSNNSGNGNTAGEISTPSNPNNQTPETPKSTLKVVNIETSNNNKLTFDPVSVTINFNEPIRGVSESGWTSINNNLSRIKVNITQNGTYKIIAYDKNGIGLTITYDVKNYHPMPNITTNIDGNGNIKITMKSEDDLGEIDGWKKESDGTYTKELGKNEDLTDLNIGGEKIKIDYTKPELEALSSNIDKNTGEIFPNNEATITITSKTGKKLLKPQEDGWILSEDGLSIYRTFYDSVLNGQIIIEDIEGNKISVNYKVEEVYRRVPQMEGLSGTKSRKDPNILSISFSSSVPLNLVPNGWKGDPYNLKAAMKVNETLPVVLRDIYNNIAFYYVTASLDEQGEVAPKSRLATEEEIRQLKEQYNLN